jgi:hypothetical protein
MALHKANRSKQKVKSSIADCYIWVRASAERVVVNHTRRDLEFSHQYKVISDIHKSEVSVKWVVWHGHFWPKSPFLFCAFKYVEWITRCSIWMWDGAPLKTKISCEGQWILIFRLWLWFQFYNNNNALSFTNNAETDAKIE